MYYKLCANDINGQWIKFQLNDSQIHFLRLRQFLSEKTAIEAVNEVKQRSRKKCAIIFGNCNVGMMQPILLRNTQFCREYFLLTLPLDYEYDNSLFDLIFNGTGELFSICDLLVIQRCNFRNAKGFFVSNENIATRFKEGNPNINIIWIPRTVFYGYFPQYFWNNPRNPKSDLFEHGDKYIFEIMETSSMNPDVEEILDKLCAEDFLTQDEISCHVKESIDQLYFQERDCDVKFAEYVEVNCRDQQIYYAPGHPNQLMMLEFTKQVLRYIGIKSDHFLRMSNLLGDNSIIGRDVPIYPCVKKFFNFKECPTKYWAHRYTWNFRGDFREFQREYIKQCWAEKFTR